MKYQYNFGFLAEWIEANENIPKGALLQALGVKSNNGVKAWIKKRNPMPVISMLRFCNSFNVPLSAFFRDLDAESDTAVFPSLPRVNDQLEPDGGYDECAERARGERSILNPLDVVVTPSVVPGLNEAIESARDRDPENGEMGDVVSVVGNISDANMEKIIEIEAKHQAQVNKLLDIIADQQKQIADLYNNIIKGKGSNENPYRVTRIYDGFVADKGGDDGDMG